MYMVFRKMTAAVVALLLATTAFPVGAVSAEVVAASGDIDQDGYLTGHDTALLSRHLLDDTFCLSEDQLAYADITGDGIVDEADVIWMHANETYALGDTNLNGRGPSIQAAWRILQYAKNKTFDGIETMTQVQFNLMDVNADFKVSILDCLPMMEMDCRLVVGKDDPFCEIPTCYYMHNETGNGIAGDADQDGVITRHDAAIVCSFLYTDNGGTLKYVAGGDINGDGEVDQADADEMIAQDAQSDRVYKSGEFGSIDAAYQALYYTSIHAVNGRVVRVISQEEADAQNTRNSAIFPIGGGTFRVGAVDYHLMDANADGEVTEEDVSLLLAASSRVSVGGSYYPSESCYVLY